MSFLARILGGKSGRERMLPLYQRVVATGRDPAWYRGGEVPDTVDGRFDILAAVMALVLLRLEREEDRRTQVSSTLLTELFIDDMDGSLRQLGIGDLVVGKHMGKLMGALGGRLGAFREAVNSEGAMTASVKRNVFHEAPPSDAALRFVTERLLRFHAALAAAPAPALLQGELPAL
ncbi:MAG: hypothetical protein AVDCRST_MAG23-1445 [uncultured Sphingosinicella sp.]|uniref:Ubiquinol-cytochrome c chaperone domain-containing protein n=1 Tax=uncultured Sphingosinicella sp. TaxID=478748 RepID=A0A6J4U235_9SPHN|nr:ubiquinol-cytochrome C chaperone family protein [uncultured Sphingosinicella sp.]CAA9536744.1 MAG: hypothetical protein AVDCRST_MAG23-1445 [uncultured Sphingosinicella sp.]